MRSFESQLYFLESLPPTKNFESAVVIYDKILLKKNLRFKNWLNQFAMSYGVKAGESLKDFDTFATHLKKLSQLVNDVSPRNLKVLAIGGGSVGDFAGFFASIYKRGVALAHFPTTYLSAIDSAHGGKTALNLGGSKNQIGSFYPADEVWIVAELLRSQTEAQLADARAELAKICLLDKKMWSESTRSGDLISFDEFISLTEPAIRAKMNVVLKDPFERSTIRQTLNLGHTFGHVLEARLGLSHGAAVAQGLLFALRWSAEIGILRDTDLKLIEKTLAKRFAISPAVIPLKASDIEKLLRQDKKVAAKDEINFVFLETIGKPSVKTVRVEQIVKEAHRQQWVGRQVRQKRVRR